MVDPLKVLWVLTNSTYLVSKFLKTGVTETEDPPYFAQSLYQVQVKENEELHRPIITVAAENHEEATNIRYEIAGGNVGLTFAVDKDTGAISLAAPLDYESKKKFDLRLSATDGESASYTSLQVTVLDVNDNPPVFLTSSYRAQVTEEDDVGLPKKILQVNVTDADRDRPLDIVYSLTGPGVDPDDPANGKFSINKTSGEVFVLKPLDRDLPHGRPQWRFTVFAQDEGGEGLVGFADIHVNLKDVNDNAPAFLQTTCSTNITENGTAGLVVLRMAAVDQDDPEEGGNAQLLYNIEKNVLDEQTGTPIFSVEPRTGVIRTNVCCLDREKTPDYTLQIVAVDGGGLKGTGTVSILVTDINDMPPMFTKEEWVTEVAESQGGVVPDHAVLTVNVVDQDETNNFFYKVVEGSGPGTERFTMVRNPDGTGSLRVVQPLDYEDPMQRNGFRFKIQGPNSTEDKYHVAYSWVSVRLRDVNDNSPQFLKKSSTVSLQEDATPGTLVDSFPATDPDQAGHSQVTLNIDEKSDPRRHFHISQEGAVTVQRPLDRETKPLHKLVITAEDDGDPSLTATASLTVTVLDVNDHAPELLEDYRPVLQENSPPRVILEVYARDRDDHAKGNGPPYTFLLDPAVNNTLGRLFSVETNPRGDQNSGVAVVSSLVTFDREEQREFLLPLLIQDSGDPLMVATSTLTVVIGDVNDNKMAAGTTDILVYKLEGSEEEMLVGRVNVDDPDDWDLPDKSFFWESAPEKGFRLDQHSGGLRMSARIPEGEYRMRFRVRDSRHPLEGSVVSNVTVRVRPITRRDLEHSAELTLLGVSNTDFIKSTNVSTSCLEAFRETVGRLLSTLWDQVHVFSVETRHHHPPQTNVRFFVKEDSQYFKPVRLHAVLTTNRQAVENALSVKVVSVGPTGCRDEAVCEGAGGCEERQSLDPGGYRTVNANTTVLTGPNVLREVRCGCAAREYTTVETCFSLPCFNGGTCFDTPHGPRCSCPEYHDGPRCQQTVRGFPGGKGWAWFPPLPACSPSHLSLEVLTSVSDGTIIYHGPLAKPDLNSPLVTDLLCVEMVEGVVRLLLDLGSGAVNITVPVRLDDAEWHRVDILWDDEEVRLVVDQCRGQNMTDSVDREVSEKDLSECLAAARLPLFDSQLNLVTPLQIGGRNVQEFDPEDYGWGLGPQGKGLDGCVRNIVFNGEIVDLADPAVSQTSSPRCPHTAAACSSCSAWSVCEASQTAARCRCPPGSSGPSCSTPTVPSTFLPGGLVKFALSFEPDRFSTTLQLRFRTRERDGEMFRLVDQHLREYILLEISNRHLRVRMNLNGSRPQVRTLSLEHVTVDDGRWHFVKVSRHGSCLTLQLDGGEGRRYNESFRFRGHQLISVDKQEGVYAGGPSDLPGFKSSLVVASFNQGCLDDIRLDGRLLPLPPALNGSQWGQASLSQGVERHCHSRNVCADVKCPDSFLCQDIWNDYVCSCGDGKVATVDGRACEDRNECLDSPCLNGGFCVNQDSRLRYRCVCPEGFWGQQCQLVQERQSMRLGLGALLTMVGCLLLILVLVALFVAYTRRRDPGGIKKAGPEDDVRENIISYNDEGGGDDDLNAFDLLPLKGGAADNKNKLPVPELIEESGLEARIEGRRKRADLEHTTPPFDDLRNYAFEGNCDSVQGSLSSLDSCVDSEESVRMVVLGPRFSRLVNIYTSGTPSSAPVTRLEATV